MKIAIAGLGSAGRRHLKNLKELGIDDLVLIRSGNSILPEEELRGIPAVGSLIAAMDLQPDAIIISNPTSLHIELAIPAAKAGCHLLIEKPLSDNLQGVKELAGIVRSNGCQVLIGYQFRFNPGLMMVFELLQSHSIGKPLSYRSQWSEWLPGWHPWEDYRQGYSARRDLGGGVTLTLSHPLDYCYWLFGEVDSLWAFSQNHQLLEIDVEDTIEIGILHKNGCIGSIHLDYNGRPPTHRLEIIGSQGTIQWEYESGETRIYQSQIPGNSETQTHNPEPDYRWNSHHMPPGFSRNEMFIMEVKHFLDIIQGKATPVCPLDDGIYSLALALSALASAETGFIQDPNNLLEKWKSSTN